MQWKVSVYNFGQNRQQKGTLSEQAAIFTTSTGTVPPPPLRQQVAVEWVPR